MQRTSVNLLNDCDGNQLNYNNDVPAIGNKNYVLQKPFETDFLTVIIGKNGNSVLPILIEKNFEQKIYFCVLKISSIFFKEG